MNDLRTTLKDRADLRKYLFVRGFLMTNDSSIDGKSFPFFGEWKCTRLGSFYVWTHRDTGFYWIHQDERIFFLFGHAYNPFTMEISESNILKRIVKNELVAQFSQLSFYPHPDITKAINECAHMDSDYNAGVRYLVWGVLLSSLVLMLGWPMVKGAKITVKL